MGVDLGYEGVHFFRRDFGGAQRGAEAEFGGLEIGPQTPDDPAFPHGPHAGERLGFGEAETFAQYGVRPGSNGKIRLDDVQQLFVDGVHVHGMLLPSDNALPRAAVQLRSFFGSWVHNGSGPR